jgi:hypothetical protein
VVIDDQQLIAHQYSPLPQIASRKAGQTRSDAGNDRIAGTLAMRSVEDTEDAEDERVDKELAVQAEEKAEDVSEETAPAFGVVQR